MYEIDWESAPGGKLTSPDGRYVLKPIGADRWELWDNGEKAAVGTKEVCQQTASLRLAINKEWAHE